MKALFKNTKAIIFIAVVLLLSAAAFFVLQQNPAEAGSLYETETARIGDIASTVETTGTVRAYQSALYTWETSGVVGEVNVEIGDTVTKDTALALLQKSSLSPELIQAEADLVNGKREQEDLLGSAGTEAANAAIALREAQEAYDDAVNYRNLLDEEVEYDVFVGFGRISTPFGNFKIPKINNIKYYPSEEQKEEAEQDIVLQKALLDDAQREYDRLKDGLPEREIAAAEAKVLAAQTVLDQANITTTFGGIITDVTTQVGDRVMAGDQAFRVDDLSSLMIDLNVSEIDINNISVGQGVTIDFEAIPNKTYRGAVVDIAMASSSSTSGTGFNVTVEITDADEAVKPGMSASIFIQIREVQGVLMIPNQAIRILNGERVVYLLRTDETLEPAPIRLGVRSESYSEVVSGNVQVGDLIVLNPPSNTAGIQ